MTAGVTTRPWEVNGRAVTHAVGYAFCHECGWFVTREDEAVAEVAGNVHALEHGRIDDQRR